jgi:hypothetical protein
MISFLALVLKLTSLTLASIEVESQDVSIESYRAVSIRRLHYATLSSIIQLMVQSRNAFYPTLAPTESAGTPVKPTMHYSDISS